MPKLDKTGPMGQGAGTGRGLGYCGGGMRRGWGCWGGYGHHGFRRFIFPKNELATLEDEEKMLKEELAAIREEKAALLCQDQGVAEK